MSNESFSSSVVATLGRAGVAATLGRAGVAAALGQAPVAATLGRAAVSRLVVTSFSCSLRGSDTTVHFTGSQSVVKRMVVDTHIPTPLKGQITEEKCLIICDSLPVPQAPNNLKR